MCRSLDADCSLWKSCLKTAYRTWSSPIASADCRLSNDNARPHCGIALPSLSRQRLAAPWVITSVVPPAIRAQALCTLLQPCWLCFVATVFCFEARWSVVKTAFFRFHFDWVVFRGPFCSVPNWESLIGRFGVGVQITIGLLPMFAFLAADPRFAWSGGRCVFREWGSLEWSFLLFAASFIFAIRVLLCVCRSSGTASIALYFRYSATPQSFEAVRSLSANHGNSSKYPPFQFQLLVKPDRLSSLYPLSPSFTFLKSRWHVLLLQILNWQIYFLV